MMLTFCVTVVLLICIKYGTTLLCIYIRPSDVSVAL